MENKGNYDVIVIGGGPIGLWASYYSGFRGLKTLLVEASDTLGGQAIYLYPQKEITDLPGIPAITGKELVDNLVLQMNSVQVDSVLQTKVTSILDDNGNKAVITDKGKFEGKYVLLTPGIGNFVPNKLGNPQVERFENHGLYYYVKNKEDFRNKSVMIVGGGDSAVDWAVEMINIAREIYLVHRRDEFRAAEANIKKIIQAGVKIFTPYILDSLTGDGKIEKAVLKKTTDSSQAVINVDSVLLMLGYKLDLSTIKGWNINLGQDGIFIDANCITNDPRILGAGDIASPREGIKQKLLVIGFAQATTAVNYISKALRPSYPTFVHSTTKS
ncbi:MAG: NAD(P)/FAD-dependent oxidoreductase [Nitrososphaerota archaeon]|nr:NAD(P)/FAD-dependent oxidoreductase [Nitrososphaerota archaeon]MDG6930499.1 NAD(P)/FAD-dependent oxidoreductase [Nitrososphaerota archaeon]